MQSLYTQHKMKMGCTCDHSVSHMMIKNTSSSFHVVLVEKERFGLNVVFIFIY